MEEKLDLSIDTESPITPTKTETKSERRSKRERNYYSQSSAKKVLFNIAAGVLYLIPHQDSHIQEISNTYTNSDVNLDTSNKYLTDLSNKYSVNLQQVKEKTEHESTFPSNEKVEGVIKLVEKVIVPYDSSDFKSSKREIGKRVGMCNQASDLIRNAVETYFSEGSAKVVSVYDLYKTVTNDNELHNGNPFSHRITIVTMDNKDYLVDLTFVQFLNKNNKEVSEFLDTGKNTSVADYAENPIVQELIKKGYFEMTPKNLKDYFRLTIGSQGPDFLKEFEYSKYSQTEKIDYDTKVSMPKYRLEETLAEAKRSLDQEKAEIDSQWNKLTDIARTFFRKVFN